MLAFLKRWVPHLGAVSNTERLRASLGALAGLVITGLVSRFALGSADPVLLIAPMGASAVLLFAVPSSPLAQPWSILGGNTIAALIGVTVARFVGDPVVAAALACACAIGAMLVTRCLHPPSGAVALTAVLGGPAVHAAGYQFVLWPVGLNSLLLLGAAVLFNNVTGRRYPHPDAGRPPNPHKTADPLPSRRLGATRADLEAVLKQRDEIVDVDPGDLEVLLHDAEARAYGRRFGAITVGDIMSRDVASIQDDMPIEDARDLMRRRQLRALPVLDRQGQLAGIVTPGDLLNAAEFASGTEAKMPPDRAVATVMTRTVRSAAPDMRLAELVPAMADLALHHVPVIDNARLVGIVTQSDVIAALYRGLGDSSLSLEGSTV